MKKHTNQGLTVIEVKEFQRCDEYHRNAPSDLMSLKKQLVVSEPHRVARDGLKTLNNLSNLITLIFI